MKCQIVSIHAPTRGATVLLTSLIVSSRFQFTHPRGVRRYEISIMYYCLACFNSRTHAGCDPVDVGSIQNSTLNVSIHAPTRGATGYLRLLLATICVSIHAPTRGATRYCVATYNSILCFNSRTHAGCDFPQAQTKDKLCRFNSRTHAGCDALR